ncbi:MAG: DUF1566 domain-containing protein [Deltaproteobacteria bacterium]|nr:DUF1566 domain-containing protein [Deltaproteobacteria bacterium]MBW1938762.1 DUF1566 domain-containing protein [Deltaproteobacteria bacterium]MBW1965101.1 DUF1566 domain-containing protein [Deltaproteobacteria bacterium]MBW2081310.1 DUF1566 domain-containing protein [Deltaproteobacteria bacterium]MBW2351301.1 DUF1566 domain-containing protein [Deltaproteobacteria bacterium]
MKKDVVKTRRGIMIIATLSTILFFLLPVSSLAENLESTAGSGNTTTSPGETCKGTLSKGGRWCDLGDGTVKDLTSGLVWLKNARCSRERMKWFDAVKDSIENIRSGDCGLTDGSEWGDWRLPTKKELVGITASTGKEYVTSTNMQLFKDVQSGSYWTITSEASRKYNAWNVIMKDGYASVDNKAHDCYVWPVRSDN